MNDKKTEEMLNEACEILYNIEQQSDFKDFVKDYVSDELEALMGQEVDTCELIGLLCDDANSFADSDKIILQYRKHAAEIFDFLGNEVVNPFSQPEEFVYWMVEKAVVDMLANSKFISENWDNKITLDEETVVTIKSEAGINSASLDKLEANKDKVAEQPKESKGEKEEVL